MSERVASLAELLNSMVFSSIESCAMASPIDVRTRVTSQCPPPLLFPSRNPVVSVSTSGYEPAAYISGNGTAYFTFLYTVQPGDQSADLEYWNEDAFQTDGFVRRAADEVR